MPFQNGGNLESAAIEGLAVLEQRREKEWRGLGPAGRRKLSWRAHQVRHFFHVLPGESVLELGAGSGQWTTELSSVLRGENPITAVSFNSGNGQSGFTRIPNAESVALEKLRGARFDYIVGNSIIPFIQCEEILRELYGLLKPGGRMVLFTETRGGASREQSISTAGPEQIINALLAEGFSNIEVIPFDLLPANVSDDVLQFLRSKIYPFEQMPLLSGLCSMRSIWAQKPGDEDLRRPSPNLAHREELYNSVSVVLPCHNEAMNIECLVTRLLRYYRFYIHEIIIVNDNSTDDTAKTAATISSHEPCVRLINRRPPNGVGRALADGYAAARGKFILSMDCDFSHILPELRDLFDAVADGFDGAIGSRFSHHSVILNYPPLKVLGDRIVHLLIKVFLIDVRDLSNNLKLYRADILKQLQIEEPHFAANLEIGLKPLLAGYKIKEVPISWINREANMGLSSFNPFRVGPAYFSLLARIIWKVKTDRKAFLSSCFAGLQDPAVQLERGV